ncbi:MAG: hypothetical protein IKJ19_04730 [Clostridia bacterium]|nr:hypothetical protein [Clostridia bacterium]
MRKVLFIFLCFFLSAVSLLSLIIVPLTTNSRENATTSIKTLEIWHLDMIEGGIGSRTTFLKKVAKKFSDITGTVVRVTHHTPTSAIENFNNNIYPNLISYSAGLDLPYAKLVEIEKDSYAECWCKGGYLLISRKGQKIDGIILSMQEYALSAIAYYMEDIKIPIVGEYKSTDAIYAFYGNKNYALLGTQRDLFRLQNKGIEIEIKQLSRFNDLNQYISIISTSNKNDESKKFISYLLSYCKGENALENIGMLTPNGYSNACNSLLNIFNESNHEYTTYPILSGEQLKNLKNMCKNYQMNAQSIKNALKRLK